MRFIVIIAIIIAIELYSFQAIRVVSKASWVKYLYFLPSLLFVISVFFGFINRQWYIHFQNLNGIIFSFILAKLFTLPFLFFEDIVRVITFIYHKLSANNELANLPSRRKFISQMALFVSAVPFSGLVYGIIKGKYNYRVHRYEIAFDDLPSNFDGFTITQISDIHSGSFDNTQKVEYGIDLINQQKSDLILFTGDLVNNFAKEMDPWIPTFSKLSAPKGKLSVLGNHDYGDYTSWENEREKEKNFNRLKSVHQELGFDLLLNEHRIIEKDGQQLNLIGVENWGRGRFTKKGDINKAIEKINPEGFNILMSHDPSHWEEVIINHPCHFHLTLSGHTHGMQMGIEIPGFKRWSPSKWVYKYWAGLYKEKNQYLNVNRGFGFIGYPGRLGIWPEITVITLKQKKNNA